MEFCLIRGNEINFLCQHLDILYFPIKGGINCSPVTPTPNKMVILDLSAFKPQITEFDLVCVLLGRYLKRGTVSSSLKMLCIRPRDSRNHW